MKKRGVPAGQITHFISVQEDISQIKKTEEQLRHGASHDLLTGLPNRRGLSETLASVLPSSTAQRLTAEIAQCIWDNLRPQGVAVVVKATHGCMTGRGVRTHGVDMVTSKVLGCFRDDPRSRKEVFSLMGLK